MARRSNPDLLILNPEVQKAVAAYKRFHHVEPKDAIKIGKGKRALIALGDALEIVYRPTRGARKGPAFVHRFGKGAVILATDAEGRDLYLVRSKGSKMHVDFERGIVG